MLRVPMRVRVLAVRHRVVDVVVVRVVVAMRVLVHERLVGVAVLVTLRQMQHEARRS